MRQINRSTTPVNANRSSRKIGNGLVTLSSAAVLAVYSAGYLRTRSAADRLTLEAAQRRPPVPSPERAGTPPGRALDKTRPGAAPVTAVPATRVVEAPTAALAPAGPPRKAMAPARSAPAPLPSSKPVAATRRAIEQPAAATPAATVEASDTAPAAAAPPSVPLPAIAASEPAAPQPAALAATVPGKWKDGSYTGWGTSRHGDIEATVVVAGGRIASAVISQCLTRYSCSWIAPLPPQVAIRQSPEVDYVSGATQSTNAFYYAVVEALSKAK